MSYGVLSGVGRTPLVELKQVKPASGARIAVKLEAANPTGSMKDRMAAEVIRSAAADGRLTPGGLSSTTRRGRRANDRRRLRAALLEHRTVPVTSG